MHWGFYKLRELAKFNAAKEEMHKYIRELEQKNNDLERTNRYVNELVNISIKIIISLSLLVVQCFH
jgi:hypothetical protein